MTHIFYHDLTLHRALQVQLAASLGGGRRCRADEPGALTTGGRVHGLRLGRGLNCPGPVERVQAGTL